MFDAPLRRQFDAFLDDHRQILLECIDGLTEEQARRRLVPSRTTLLSLLEARDVRRAGLVRRGGDGRGRAPRSASRSRRTSPSTSTTPTPSRRSRPPSGKACDDSRRATPSGARRRAPRQPARPAAAALGHAAHAARACPALRSRRDPARAGAGRRRLTPRRSTDRSPPRRRPCWHARPMTTDSRPSIRATSVTVMTPDPRGLADFYARLLGAEVSATEPAPPGGPEAAGWAQVRMPHLTLNFEYEEQWSARCGPPRPGSRPPPSTSTSGSTTSRPRVTGRPGAAPSWPTPSRRTTCGCSRPGRAPVLPLRLALGGRGEGRRPGEGLHPRSAYPPPGARKATVHPRPRSARPSGDQRQHGTSRNDQCPP